MESLNIDFFEIVNIINTIFWMIGLWFMFPKSKVKKWWAIVPIATRYHFAKCADREDEATIWVVTEFFYYIFYVSYNVLEAFGKEKILAGYACTIMMISFSLISFIYEIRVYNGICQVYDKKKRWVFLWILARGPVASYFGLNDKLQPNYIPVDEEAAKESGEHISALNEGLTININKRTTRKGFTTKTMLKDIHLAIEPGKMVLLLGGSGAGKTTFFNAVTGYEKADATIFLNGHNVYERFDKMKYEIGFVPQQDLLRLNDTVYNTLSDAAELRLPTSVSKEDKAKRIEEVMQMFGLSALRNNIIAKQSGGQKKRISIAMEYISDPSLFILDEPDSGLDGILARELMQRLHDISREGKIVIVITHTPDRVIDLFDQIIVLAKDSNRTGRLVYFGDVADAKKFFGKDKMEDIVKVINRPDEGGEGRADELVEKFAEERNVTV